MGEGKILRSEKTEDPNLMQISNNKEFIILADSLFEELKSYLAIEDRNLKKIWDMKDWPSAMAGLYQYIKTGMTDPTQVMRRGTLIQLLAYTIVCYSSLDQDESKKKAAQLKITQQRVDDGEKKDQEKKVNQEAAKQALRDALLDTA